MHRAPILYEISYSQVLDLPFSRSLLEFIDSSTALSAMGRIFQCRSTCWDTQISFPCLLLAGPGQVICSVTTEEVALQGGVSVWSAEGLREGRVRSGVTGKDWRAVLGKVRCSQYGRYLANPLLSVS